MRELLSVSKLELLNLDSLVTYNSLDLYVCPKCRHFVTPQITCENSCEYCAEYWGTKGYKSNHSKLNVKEISTDFQQWLYSTYTSIDKSLSKAVNTKNKIDMYYADDAVEEAQKQQLEYKKHIKMLQARSRRRIAVNFEQFLLTTIDYWTDVQDTVFDKDKFVEFWEELPYAQFLTAFTNLIGEDGQLQVLGTWIAYNLLLNRDKQFLYQNLVTLLITAHKIGEIDILNKFEMHDIKQLWQLNYIVDDLLFLHLIRIDWKDYM